LKSLKKYEAAEVRQAAAQDSVAHQGFLISTDPPYYDNVGYADLSDFFYVWLRRSLRQIYPRVFSTMLVPKTAELVAIPYRHKDRNQAEAFFLEGMMQAMTRMARQCVSEMPVTIYYAFKQSESGDQGVSSTGWETFLDAILRAGFSVSGTWPVRTERGVRSISMGTNALASSIVLVCRRRPDNALTITRGDFRLLLKRELSNSLKPLQKGSIAPVDMAQASIGPGMAIFSRHANVIGADGSAVSVRRALQLINEIVDEVRGEEEAEFDRETRFAITWFETYGFQSGPFGDAETLAKARNISVTGVQSAGLLKSVAGKVQLMTHMELPEDWNPEDDRTLTVWECTQHLIKRLGEGGEAAAAELLAKIGSHAEPARNLAYRLYTTCERRGWTDEARAYNGLVIAWPELERLASEMENSSAGETAQQTGLFDSR
jgi:putative DNA methylase